MTAGARQAQRTELLAEIRQSNLSTSAKRELAALVKRCGRSNAALSRANLERQERVRAAIHRAADRHLSKQRRAGTPPERWPGALWDYLGERYGLYGLDRRPSRRVIKAALELWKPGSAQPIGRATFVSILAAPTSGANDGKRKDEHRQG